jgi:DeoR family transcriptional regulator, copper-sensing transcriptional repressor
MDTLPERQQKMLKTLNHKLPTSVETLASLLEISTPTVYREMRELIDKGMAKKTRGGFLLLQSAREPADEGKCVYCGGPVQGRGTFIIQLTDGLLRAACCPHCGLLALEMPGVRAALATDFLYGRRINVGLASFLIGSSVSLCCEPSVLCFRSFSDAEHFQKGFGGDICTIEEAKLRIKSTLIVAN